MTSLQAEYSKLLEARRHDIAQEQLGNRQLDEDTRHHMRTEDQTDAANAIARWSKEVDITLSREKMANDRQIAQLKAASDQLIQSMKGEIEQRKLDQYERELNASIAKMQTDAAANTTQANAAMMKAEAERNSVDAKNAANYAKAQKDQTYAFANWRGTVTKIAHDAWGSAAESTDKLARELTGGQKGLKDVSTDATVFAGINPAAWPKQAKQKIETAKSVFGKSSKSSKEKWTNTTDDNKKTNNNKEDK